MKKTLLFIGGIGALGYALYKYFKIQTDLLKNFEYKIVGIKIKKITKTELPFDLKIRFISKSSIDAKVSRIYLDVFVEGSNVGYVSENKEFLIPSNGSSDIDLAFSFNPQVILKNLSNIILSGLGKKDLAFGLKGFANVKSGFISTTIPIDYQTTIKDYLKG